MGRYTYDRKTEQLAPVISNSLIFYGDYDPTTLYNRGAVTLIDGEPHDYLENGVWEPIGTVDPEPANKVHKITYSHCKSCGAPVDSYKRRCEYCGVEYAECM